MKGCSVDVDIPVNGLYFEMYMLLFAYYQVLLLFIYIYIRTVAPCYQSHPTGMAYLHAHTSTFSL